MAFNLKNTLKAFLLSSSEPLTIKDIQAVFDRYHEQYSQARKDDSEEIDDSQENEAAEEAALDETVDNTAVSEEIEETDPIDEEDIDTPPPLDPVNAASVEEMEEAGNPPADDTTSGDLLPEKETPNEGVPSLVTSAQIREAMDEIAVELRESDDVYMLIEGATGYRIVTHPRYARWIRILRHEPPPVKLTQTALETLAIVAYRQPITRSEIEAIRGVSAEAGLNRLLERELVVVTGRADLPGRPLQYGTTDKFLEYVGIKSVVELPSSDVLSPRQVDDWIQNITQAAPPADGEMGLPLEEGEGDTPNNAEVAFDTTPTDELPESLTPPPEENETAGTDNSGEVTDDDSEPKEST